MEIEIALLKQHNKKYDVVQIVKERYKDILYINQYSIDEDINYLQLGIRLINIEGKEYGVYLEQKDKHELVYDLQSGYFIQQGEQEKIGISKAGFVKIGLYNKKSKYLYRTETLLVKPKIISLEQYEQMISLIKNINQELIISNASYVNMELNAEVLSLADKVKAFLESIKLTLDLINEEPAVGLIKEYEKVKREKLKKYSSKILIEQAIYPNKRKYTTEQTRETTNIYENRIIYFSLYRISKIIYLGLQKCTRDQKRLKEECSEIERILSNIDKKILKDNNEQIYIQQLQSKKIKVDECIKRNAEELDIWNESEQIIKKYLKYKLFKNFTNKLENRETLKLTSVFIHDIRYRYIYTALKEFYNNAYNETDIMQQDMIGIKELYEIFEVWTFLEMIRALVIEQRWKLQNNNLAKSIREYYRKNKSLYGFSVNLLHNLSKKRQMKLILTYNKTLIGEDYHLRPDYTFEYECEGVKKTFYLDAKYHDYAGKTNNVFKDITETAINKYYNTLINTEYKATGSYIVHCVEDKENIFYGGKKQVNHRCGGFSLIPNNSTHFLTWISLCMEWFYKEYDVCWNCGSVNVEEKEELTTGNKRKYHYTCHDCKSFWVKTHCDNCGNDIIIKHDLPQKQYHILTSEKWMVHCPICDSAGGVNKNTMQTISCPKCHGTGYIRAYRHIQGGRCFDCGGSGIKIIYR